MELFGRELSIEQVIGLVECNASPDEDLVHRAALELIAALRVDQRKEKADAELIRKIYFATDEDLCDCCRKIVRMIEAWWNDDEKGEAE